MFYLSSVLPIHFDLPRHELPLETFVTTAQSAAAIARTINEKFLGGSLALEVVVLAPQEGTYLARLKFRVVGVSALIGAIAGGPLGDFGSGLVHGLTTVPPTEWGEQIGTEVRQAVSDLLDPHTEEPVKCQAGAFIAVSATRLVLESENDYLRMLGVVEVAPEVLEAKRKFYDACLSVPDLSGIGFQQDAHFPVRREDFRRMREGLPKDEAGGWELAVEDIKVTSPNWNRDDHARTWKAIDRERGLRFFRILDEVFWGRIARGELKTRINDGMRVQWIFQRGPHGPKNHKVLSVLEFNGSKVSPPKSDDEVGAIVSKFVRREEDEPSFFDEDE